MSRLSLPDEEFRALIEQAHLLEELTKHPGWPVLVDYLEHRMESDKRAVLNGLVADRDDYLKRTGTLIGTTFAINAPAAVAEIVQSERNRRSRDDAAQPD